MSKIAIIGATGRAGSQLLEEALRRGHSVTAIARNTAKIAVRPGVTSKAVDALDAAALEAAVAGHDVVISAAHFATLPAAAVVGPVKKAGVKRLLVVGGAGSLLLPDITAGSSTAPVSRRSTRPRQAPGRRSWRVCVRKRNWTGASCRRRRSSSKVSALAVSVWARITCW